ncbi:MAG TPA: serine/threonine-protein kinase [Longimicrobium sp.]|nr:serine/threonine-protein kinase [Longimicrobium sp.]
MLPDRADVAGHVVAGRYELQRALGSGAFGHTFLARDREGGRTVALKLLDPRGATDWKAYELFEREAAVLRSVRHHGVPQVHDVVHDSWNGAPAAFLVMEYVEGTPLQETIDAQRPLDPAEVLHLFLEMLGILDYLHGRVPPILHRDIKPANVIVRPDGQPALVDFGSVRRVFLDADEAGSTVAGTYGYMPYEQHLGQATPASDLYALGATFLHLLTGRPPRDFMGDDGRIRVPDALPGDPRLQPVIARLLRPVPAERFASAREVRQALLASTAVQRAANAPLPAAPAKLEALLQPGPRPIQGAAKELLRRATPGALDLMDTSSKRGDRPGVLDWLVVGFFSVLTVGTLPMVFVSLSRARRRQLRRFIHEGLLAEAEVTEIGQEPTAFGEKISRVGYQFQADGTLHRDSDRVLPAFANRWRPGDRIHVLYIPDQDYESVIISTS